MSDSKKKVLAGIFMFIGFLALVAAFANTVSKINEATDNLYQHPFIVSNSVQKIKTNLLQSQVLFHSIVESDFYNENFSVNQLKVRIQTYNARIEEDFSQVEKYYLGNPNSVKSIQLNLEKLNKKYNNFYNAIAIEHKKEPYDLLIAQIDPLFLMMLDDLEQLHVFAQNKAIEFKNAAHQDYFESIAILVFIIIYVCLLVAYIYFLNISHVKRALKSLELHYKWRKNILNSTPDAILIISENGKIIDCNEQATLLFGYTSDELKQLEVEALIPQKLRRIHKEHRKVHLKSSFIRPMSNLDGLKVLLRTGKELDVAISLNETEINNKKVYISAIRDITREVKIRDEIEYQTNFDVLTGLANRNMCEKRFEQLVSKGNDQNSNLDIALFFIDLDDFKKVNDTLGHDTGDKLLCQVAERLSGTAEKHGLVGRLGGDEFILILEVDNDEDSVKNLAFEIVSDFKRTFFIDASTLKISCSIGVALYPCDGKTYSEILRKADAAMYHAKSLGKNQFTYYFDSLTVGLSKYFKIEEAFLTANIEQEFYMVFQPQIDFSNNEVIGAEALIRWEKRANELIPPQEFIPVAENNGKILELGEFIIRESLNFALMAINLTGNKNFKISINVSPKQLMDHSLLEKLIEHIDDRGLSASNLALEITEGVLLDSSSSTIEILEKIANANIILSMDDFGTGYSSLSYLRKFPFKHVKLDKSFIDDLAVSDNAEALIRSSIMMAHALDLKVVAEGVETKEQSDILASFGCDYAQGYYYSKPLKKNEFKILIRDADKYISKIEDAKNKRQRN